MKDWLRDCTGRTTEGLLLERLFHTMKYRWILCWNGLSRADSEGMDCACCITWPDDKLYCSCGCVCHSRIEKMALHPDIQLFLRAVKAMDIVPKIPESMDEAIAIDYWHKHGDELILESSLGCKECREKNPDCVEYHLKNNQEKGETP